MQFPTNGIEIKKLSLKHSIQVRTSLMLITSTTRMLEKKMKFEKKKRMNERERKNFSKTQLFFITFHSSLDHYYIVMQFSRSHNEWLLK